MIKKIILSLVLTSLANAQEGNYSKTYKLSNEKKVISVGVSVNANHVLSVSILDGKNKGCSNKIQLKENSVSNESETSYNIQKVYKAEDKVMSCGLSISVEIRETYQGKLQGCWVNHRGVCKDHDMSGETGYIKRYTETGRNYSIQLLLEDNDEIYSLKENIRR